MIRTSARSLFQACFLTFVAATACWSAINRGSIRGTVTDPQGALVPSVHVTITNTDTGVEQSTVSNGAGFYLAPELVPGPYKVRIAGAGFVPVEVSNITVKANEVATVDAQLQLGKSMQAVQVVATTPMVSTDAANFGTQLEQLYVQELPMTGRDIQGLAALVPGVTQSQGPPGTLVGFTGQFAGFPDPTHIVGSQLSANGSQASANVWYLDGNLNAAQGQDNMVVDPAPDAVGEFQAVTDAYAPEYGRNGGAVFNVVLKSGSNSPHGSLYEINQNSYFHARNPFAGTDASGRAIPPDYINWNQFGGTFGGPVVIPKIYNGKNRTFFFGAWDVSILHGRRNGIFTVPTLGMHQGDFSDVPSVQQYGIYDPMTTVYDASAGYFKRQPFRNADGTLATRIPASRLDPVALWFMNQFPAPNYSDPRQQNAATGGCLNLCNNYQSSYGSGQATHNAVFKVDHLIGNTNKLFGEWLYNPTDYSLLTLPWRGATAPLYGFNGSIPFKVGNTIMALGNTTTFSPSLLNDFRFSYSRQSDVPSPVPNALGDTKGILAHLNGLNIPVTPPLQPVPQFYVGGYGFGAFGNPLTEITQAYNLLDNVSKVFSKHALKAGFLYRVDQTGTEVPIQTGINFGGGLTNNPATGQGGGALAQFLLGAVDQGSSIRFFWPTFGTTKQWAFYVQDDYRITRKLTLNYGLRYEIYGWYKDRFDNSSYFDFSRTNPTLTSRKGAIVYVATPAHPDHVLFPANKGDFAPRLNLAYAATSKTVIRGGINIIYNNALTQVQGQGNGPSEAPGYNVYQSWLGDATGQNLQNTYQVPAFLLSQGAPNLPPFVDPRKTNNQLLGPQGGGALTQVKNSHDPYITLWDFHIQQELPGNVVVTAGYVGTKGNFLVGDINRSFSYVHTSDRLKYRSKLNSLVPMPADLVPYWGTQYYQSQLLVQYPQMAYVSDFLSPDLSNSYNAFQAQVEKRFSHGLSFLAAYTFQKNIADPGFGGFLSNTWVGGPSFGSGRGRIGQVDGGNGGHTASWGAIYQDPDNRHLDRGVTADDIPQVFNLGWTYELPVGTGKPLAGGSHGVINALIGNWKLSGNFNAQMGVPLSINGPCNSLTCRVNLVGDPAAGRGSKTRYQKEQQWFNANAFQPVFGMDPAIINLATNGTPDQRDQHDEFWRFGTAGVRLESARSPGFWNVDMALAKEFKFLETRVVQFRAEAFNALNHQNLGLPNTSWCLPPNPDGSTDAVHQFGCQFGRISNVQTDPRTLQFGLKLRF